MYKIIKSMIERAERTKDYELIQDVKNLISELERTYNAPSNWDIGERLAEEYNSGWIYENLELWEYI